MRVTARLMFMQPHFIHSFIHYVTVKNTPLTLSTSRLRFWFRLTELEFSRKHIRLRGQYLLIIGQF